MFFKKANKKRHLLNVVAFYVCRFNTLSTAISISTISIRNVFKIVVAVWD